MTRLLNLLEYEETRKALEYDFRKHLGITLADVFNDQVTFRQYAAYVKGLPPDSQIVEVYRKYQEESNIPIEDFPADAWTTSEHLLARITNLLTMEWQSKLKTQDQSKDAYVKIPGTNANKPKGAKAWFMGLTGNKKE